MLFEELLEGGRGGGELTRRSGTLELLLDERSMTRLGGT
jgi:hypothetical protein